MSITKNTRGTPSSQKEITYSNNFIKTGCENENILFTDCYQVVVLCLSNAVLLFLKI